MNPQSPFDRTQILPKIGKLQQPPLLRPNATYNNHSSSPFDLSKTGNHLNVGKTFPDIAENGPHHLDASVYGKIPLTKETPPGVGGALKYRHDFGHNVSVNVDHVKDWGTTVKAQANAKLLESRDRSTQLNLGAGARQHFGPQGRSPIQGEVMVGIQKSNGCKIM